MKIRLLPIIMAMLSLGGCAIFNDSQSDSEVDKKIRSFGHIEKVQLVQVPENIYQKNHFISKSYFDSSDPVKLVTANAKEKNENSPLWINQMLVQVGLEKAPEIKTLNLYLMEIVENPEKELWLLTENNDLKEGDRVLLMRRNDELLFIEKV